jgi:ribosomal protein S18 acetylase RimI-like enzyme
MMEITATVRQAVLSDLESIATLLDAYRQFYGRSSDITAARAFLLQRFNHSESVIFVAFLGTDPVGFTQLYPSFSSVSLARIFILNDLFVSPAVRKKGVAKKLMHAAAEFAKSLGAVRVSLSTSVSNQTAQALYESMGWEKDDQFYYYHLAC